MSHLISKITVKAFVICLMMILATGVYFTTVAYHNALRRAEESELKRIQSMTSTFMLNLQGLESLAALRQEGPVQRSFCKKLAATNTLNGLNGELQVWIPGRADSSGTVLTAHGVLPAEALAGANFLWLRAKAPSHPLALGLKNSRERMRVFFAMPATIGQDKAYVLINESITEQIKQARSFFLRQSLVSVIALALFTFFGYRALKKIFRKEQDQRIKLKKYLAELDQRNKALETFSFVLSRSENLILLTDRFGKIEWMNESYGRKNNFSEDELSKFIGKNLREVSQHARIQEVLEEALLTKGVVEYETKTYDGRQREFWTSTTVTPIIDAYGEVEKLLFIDSDITKLKLAEKEVAKLANFAHENSRPVLRIDQDYTVQYSNKAGQAVLRNWGVILKQKVTRDSVRQTVKKALHLQQELELNMECENRIYSLRFHPVAEKDYVNIYGEDITEIQHAEQAITDKASRLEQFNLNITDSINYARRIQQAIIPDEDHLRQYFKDAFLISKPKDIVSGDFLWMHELKAGEQYLLALGDCTGHGVPGAMMSIISHSLLNEIVVNKRITSPDQILSALNSEIIKTLRQKQQSLGSDGLDISVVLLDMKLLTLTYAGAYQRAYWMNGKLNVLKGDRQPVGGLHHLESRKFSAERVQLSKGDSLYLCSDGFVDQFGGAENKKFLSRRLAALIEENHKFSMQAQSYFFLQAFEEWRGDAEQIDDVSLLGVKF